MRLSGAPAGGVLLADRQGQFPHMDASDDVVRQLVRLQIEHTEGPCLDTVRSGRRHLDLLLLHPHSRVRWPHFTPHALVCGFSAVTALPVRHRDHTFGALSLFHRHQSLPPAAVDACQALADAAALGLSHHRALREAQEHNAHLEAALRSRILIEQAKGILAERLRTVPADAFDRMRRHARAHRQKLIDLAAQIINGPAETGPFPRPPWAEPGSSPARPVRNRDTTESSPIG
ncbi:ANTAR domain-containing protein [Streptomyces ochraceiscleroticus]|uniref:ANTAR domain-containing protein n=1 Tax=Streptomyces ochraceiscleroticus TaxID=47761 RepID=UPI00316AE4E5